MASTFTPILGTVQQWITSDEVVRTWISVSMGRTARCSTSRSRKSPDVRFKSCVFVIIESNDLISSLSRYS